MRRLTKCAARSRRHLLLRVSEPSGKTAVVGVKDGKTKLVSAKVAEDTTAKTLLSFIREAVVPGAEVFTDGLHQLLVD